jgi:ribosomal RNA-processing protein 8
MYKTDGQKSNQLFKKDPQSFQAYHEGFQQQVTQWKVNPLDTIITNLKKK